MHQQYLIYIIKWQGDEKKKQRTLSIYIYKITLYILFLKIFIFLDKLSTIKTKLF